MDEHEGSDVFDFAESGEFVAVGLDDSDPSTWDVAASFPRARMLDAGFLVDVSGAAREAGITIPVAMTRDAWKACVAMTPAARRAGNCENGRTWDVVWMLRCATSKASVIFFELYCVTDGPVATLVQLKAVVGPGDMGEPVTTIMLPTED